MVMVVVMVMLPIKCSWCKGGLGLVVRRENAAGAPFPMFTCVSGARTRKPTPLAYSGAASRTAPKTRPYWTRSGSLPNAPYLVLLTTYTSCNCRRAINC
ncbi:hypothetical protein F4859DRAFT_496521 [Xylaria cf. heliscus]|nr:hypothetical protein F4859DRAFT_496521 [Xylaria cf. heliscus]